MIITISGPAGSGKSTVGKLLAKKLGYRYHSMGSLQRQIADERGITLLELGKLEERDKSIDEDIDRKQKEMGVKEDHFVMDSRLGFHFIPDSLKIYIDSDIDVRAKRIFHDQLSDRSAEKNLSVADTKKKIQLREASEVKRYQQYYHVNPYDLSNYDLVIDGSEMTIEQNADIILEFIQKTYKGISKPKNHGRP